LASSNGSRVLTIIFAVSVNTQKRIVTVTHTRTVPIEIPPIRAWIVAEISVPLVSVFVRQDTVIHTGVVEVK